MLGLSGSSWKGRTGCLKRDHEETENRGEWFVYRYRGRNGWWVNSWWGESVEQWIGWFSYVGKAIAEGNKVENDLLDKILETVEVFDEENLFTNEGTSCAIII